MTDITSAAAGEKPRLEDATTVEEFQARRDAELDRINAAYRSGRARTRLIGFIVAMIPYGYIGHLFFQASGWAKAGMLALGLAYMYVAVRIANRYDGTTRRRELARLSKRWQARAAADEVPRTAP
jgi:hypothetical protein